MKILLRGFDDTFYVPHSRHTEVREEDIDKVPQSLKFWLSPMKRECTSLPQRANGNSLLRVIQSMTT